MRWPEEPRADRDDRAPGPCPPRAGRRDDRPAAAVREDPAEPGGLLARVASPKSARRHANQNSLEMGGGRGGRGGGDHRCCRALARTNRSGQGRDRRPRSAAGPPPADRPLLPGGSPARIVAGRRARPGDSPGAADPALDPRRPVLGRVGTPRTALGVGPRRGQPVLDRLRAAHGRAHGRRRGPVLAQRLLRSPLAEL